MWHSVSHVLCNIMFQKIKFLKTSSFLERGTISPGASHRKQHKNAEKSIDLAMNFQSTEA